MSPFSQWVFVSGKNCNSQPHQCGISCSLPPDLTAVGADEVPSWNLWPPKLDALQELLTSKGATRAHMEVTYKALQVTKQQPREGTRLARDNTAIFLQNWIFLRSTPRSRILKLDKNPSKERVSPSLVHSTCVSHPLLSPSNRALGPALC